MLQMQMRFNEQTINKETENLKVLALSTNSIHSGIKEDDKQSDIDSNEIIDSKKSL